MKRVRIANPVPGGAMFTTRRAADRYVRQGRAKFETPGLIRFIDSNHRNASAVASQCGYDRANGSGLVKPENAVHIPFTNVQAAYRTATPSERGVDARRAEYIDQLIKARKTS